MQLLAERQIPLETCFTSNLQTKAVDRPETYPLAVFLEREIPVTVNTDNMTVSGTELCREYTLLQQQFGFSLSTLQTIACNAADAAFLPPEQADKLKGQIAQRFSRWLGA